MVVQSILVKRFKLILISFVVLIIIVIFFFLRVVLLIQLVLELAVLQIEAARSSSRVLELLPRGVLLLSVSSALHLFYLSLQLLNLALQCLLVLGGGQARLLVLIEHRRRATQLILQLLFAQMRLIS